MKFLIALVLFSVSSMAEVYQTEATRHIVNLDNVSKIQIRFTAKTMVDCNHASMHGSLRNVPLENGVSAMQTFVADYGVVQTEIFCGDDYPLTEVEVSTDWHEITAENGWMFLEIYAPKGYELEYKF